MLTVWNSITLDGVMQSPARPDEDTRGGFKHGGWAIPYGDAVMVQTMTESNTNPTALLFGRRTYEDLGSVWPNMPADNPYTNVINNAEKYVVSRTLKEPLSWQNSKLLKGDAVEAVDKLKAQSGKDLVILGSGELIQSLMPAKLIDRFILLIHPLVLGSGRRLFGDGDGATSLQLVSTKRTTTGVVIATYRQR